MKSKKYKIAIIEYHEKINDVLKKLIHLNDFQIIAIADSKIKEIKLPLSKNKIKLYQTYHELLDKEDPDLVIENLPLKDKIEFHRILNKNISIIDYKSLMVFLKIVKENTELSKFKNFYSLTQNYSHLLEESNIKLNDTILEVSLLNEISKTLSSSLDERNVGLYISNILQKKVKFSVFSLFLCNEDKYNLIIIPNHRLTTKVKDIVFENIAKEFKTHFNFELTKNMVNIIVEENILPSYSKKKVINNIHNIHNIPLSLHDKCQGLMSLVFCDAITKDEDHFLNIVTNQIGLFIENDRVKQVITKERNRFESILESITSAVIVIDENEKLLMINPITEIFLGISKKDVLGKNFFEGIPHKEIKDLFRTMKKQKSKLITREFQIKEPKEKITRYIKANVTKVFNRREILIGTIFVLNDLTKEKELDQLKNDFISITSHELRSPLASIREAISLVLDKSAGEINEIQGNFLSIAKRNTERLGRLINTLLDLSKIEAGKLQLITTEVNINEIFTEIYNNFSSLMKEKTIEFTLTLNPKIEKIVVDRDKLIQIITNLISNAYKFTPEGGNISVKVDYHEENDDVIKVSVQDSGIGISKKNQVRLFQKFTQVDTSLTRKVEGTGLGLVISKELIELHGGKIWLDSEENKGTTFSFILPIKNSSQTIINKKKILVVDDEKDICTLIKAHLTVKNYEVFTASNGNAALKLVNEIQPDLIILDILMPIMDGFEVCKKVKLNPLTVKIPIIMLSALDKDEAMQKAFSFGAEGYLVKPINIESLLYTLKEYLGG
ncbi:MAG: ATP-binding protein [Candidatus Margulisiibacteriota bacterium]|jgi:PAS domain S-box-containing protein